MNYAFAGNRQISCNILQRLIDLGYPPKYLLVTERSKSSHADELIKISGLSENRIFIGKSVLEDVQKIMLLEKENPDYIFGIHYPYIIPEKLLNIPKIGFLNLHPAFLPYNKGWHTPSWAILEDTTFGATLHFMSKELDEGDIIHQKKLKIESYDTANSIYQKVLKLEEEVFFEALDDIISLSPPRVKQDKSGTSHKKGDLEKIREIKLDKQYTAEDFLRILRGLTTNKENELAYYVENGKKIGVKIEFIKLDKDDSSNLNK